MRNMIQLLGGVAVAGAVAAGSTAFTASGLTKGTALTAAGASIVGGTVSQSVIGAVLDSVDFDVDPANPERIIKVTLGFTKEGGGALPDGSVVKATPTATPGTATDASFYCATTSSGSSVCTAGDTSDNDGGYYTAMSALSVSVTAP